MKKKGPEVPLSDALRKAKLRDLPVAAIRDAVKREEIPSRRSSALKGARYYVRWSDVQSYVENLRVY